MWFLAFVLVLVSTISAPDVCAQETASTPTPTTTPSTFDVRRKELESKINEYQQKLEEARRQRNTLSGELQKLDTQSYVTTLKIQETTNRIEKVKDETDILSERIASLTAKLDRQWVTFLATAYANYKQRSASLLDFLISADTADEALSSLKYHRLAQANSQKILYETQETKLNFEEQKEIRRRKEEELNELKRVLNLQKKELEKQQEAKKTLIAATRNRESEYQNIIAQAQREIAAYKNFVNITGVGTIKANAFGGGEGGYYFSQRDERWAGMRMGDSNETVLDVGCFISSIAMVFKKHGHDWTPATLASNPKYFAGGYNSGCFPNSIPTAYACTPSTLNGIWPGGLRYRRIPFSEMASLLDRGVPVIAGVRGQSHYVLVKRREGDTYIMNDPIYGPDLKVSDYYTFSGPYGVFE
jgi:peptidoglycan hydrolase CwlO-like protein